MMKNKEIHGVPTISQLEEELSREKHRKRYNSVLRSTLFTLVVVAAVSVLVATLWLPVLQIYGKSMEPCLNEGEIVISVKDKEFETGDIIAFYYNNKILVKRVIGKPGQWISIDENGTVSLDNEVLYEPYIKDKSLGQCDIEFPYQVPDGRYFVLGDFRSTSVDSRSSMMGCVAEEQIVGKIVFRVWPLSEFGKTA